MVLDLTQDEIRWRFHNLLYGLEDSINLQKVKMEIQGYVHVGALMSAALLYLVEQKCVIIHLHQQGQFNDAVFTTTRRTMERNAWVEPSEMEAYDRPSNREIPIPDPFATDETKGCTHISLEFTYPNTKVGKVCKTLIENLRLSCKRNVLVINLVLFAYSYFKNAIDFARAIRSTLGWCFVYDMWTSAQQTPFEVTELLEHLLGDCGKVYDPFMRTGANLLFAEEEYYAQADDIEHLYSSMLWRASLGAEVEHMEIADCTQNWNPQDCDTIIATPEFHQNVTDENGNEQPISSWLLSKLSDTMNFPNRRSLTILPANVLNASGKMERVRHDIIESNLLDSVILLPAGLFPKTGIATAIIMLRNGRGADDEITFADFSYFVKDEMDREEEGKPELNSEWAISQFDECNPKFVSKVSANDLRAMDYDWFVPRYVKNETDVPHGYTKVCLRDLLDDINQFSAFIGHDACVITEAEMVHSPFGFEMACDRVSDMENFNEEDYLCTRDSFFAFSLHDDLCTFCHLSYEFSFTEYAIPCDYYIYRLNPDVIDVDYFRYLLFDAYNSIREKANSLTKAERFKALVYQEYIIPTSVEEQKRLYEEAKFNHAIEKARKEGLDEAVERMKQEYMMEVRMRKHDMKPFLSQLDSQAKLITFYLDKIEGNEQVVSAIRSKLTGVSNAVSELRLHLNRLTEEDIYGTPEKLNPLEILNEFVGTFDNYSVELDVDTLALEDAGIAIPYISFCPVDFSTLVGTIKENAVAHAFVDEKQKYHFRISFSYDKAKERFIIDFMNDGKPMPQGMDKFRYGLKGEKGARSQGTGLGGYRVKSIARHYGGDYDVFCNRTQGLVTTIRVELPPYKE